MLGDCIGEWFVKRFGDFRFWDVWIGVAGDIVRMNKSKKHA